MPSVVQSEGAIWLAISSIQKPDTDGVSYGNSKYRRSCSFLMGRGLDTPQIVIDRYGTSSIFKHFPTTM